MTPHSSPSDAPTGRTPGGGSVQAPERRRLSGLAALRAQLQSQGHAVGRNPSLCLFMGAAWPPVSALDGTQSRLPLDAMCAWSAGRKAWLWAPRCPWAGTGGCRVLGMHFGPGAGLLHTVPPAPGSPGTSTVLKAIHTHAAPVPRAQPFGNPYGMKGEIRVQSQLLQAPTQRRLRVNRFKLNSWEEQGAGNTCTPRGLPSWPYGCGVRWEGLPRLWLAETSRRLSKPIQLPVISPTWRQQFTERFQKCSLVSLLGQALRWLHDGA